ncbi:MAG: methylated-DNA--[protein]-cysteine S-methyltransferase [Frankia sp.]|nr:methylated-DNA--[protein]-cysteine S-methyltransferase [Frankia sp.]
MIGVVNGQGQNGRTAPGQTGPGMTLFDSALGRCGVVWGDGGLLAVALTGPDTRGYLRAAWPDAVEIPPPPWVLAAVEAMTALLAGTPRDEELRAVPVDLSGVPEFHRRVYEVVRTIPPGSTMTYGEVAARLGMPGAARGVGRALGRNPLLLVVPCHRVLAADGALRGFSAPGGTATKRRLLELEGALPPKPPGLFDDLVDG